MVQVNFRNYNNTEKLIKKEFKETIPNSLTKIQKSTEHITEPAITLQELKELRSRGVEMLMSGNTRFSVKGLINLKEMENNVTKKVVNNISTESSVLKEADGIDIFDLATVHALRAKHGNCTIETIEGKRYDINDLIARLEKRNKKYQTNTTKPEIQLWRGTLDATKQQVESFVREHPEQYFRRTSGKYGTDEIIYEGFGYPVGLDIDGYGRVLKKLSPKEPPKPPTAHAVSVMPPIQQIDVIPNKVEQMIHSMLRHFPDSIPKAEAIAKDVLAKNPNATLEEIGTAIKMEL